MNTEFPTQLLEGLGTGQIIPYLGPAALNRAWTLLQDERDTRRLARLRAVAGDAGCHACHTQMGCTERCPKKLSPTAGIAGLKRAVAAAVLRKEL